MSYRLCWLLASKQSAQPVCIAVCTVLHSWWWTGNLSESCRVLFKNKFEELVLLVGFITRIYHDARSSECQISLDCVNANVLFYFRHVLSVLLLQEQTHPVSHSVRNFLHYTENKDRSAAQRSHHTPTSSSTSRWSAHPCNPLQFSSYCVVGRISGNNHLIICASSMRFGLFGREFL